MLLGSSIIPSGSNNFKWAGPAPKQARPTTLSVFFTNLDRQAAYHNFRYWLYRLALFYVACSGGHLEHCLLPLAGRMKGSFTYSGATTTQSWDLGTAFLDLRTKRLGILDGRAWALRPLQWRICFRAWKKKTLFSFYGVFSHIIFFLGNKREKREGRNRWKKIRKVRKMLSN